MVLLPALTQAEEVPLVQLGYIATVRKIEVSLPHSLKLLGVNFHDNSFHNLGQLNCFF